MNLETISLPQESTSQRIGRDALAAFNSAHPLSWRVKPLDGDDDAGLDLRVQVVRDEKYWTTFCVQLKSSRSPRISQTADSISVSLKTSTLNYYANITEPLMLAFVDLSTDPNPRRCSTYFVWIHDDLKTKLAGRKYLLSDQDTHTFSIPRSSRLDSNLDVAPYLGGYLQARRAADGLFGAVTTAVGGAFESALHMSERIEQRVVQGGLSFLSSLTEDAELPWLNVTFGPITRQLQIASEMLDQGQDRDAGQLLDKIGEEEPQIGRHERAEFYFLLSRRAELSGDRHLEASYARLGNRACPDIGRYLARRVDSFSRGLSVRSLPRYARRLLKIWPSSTSTPAVAVKSKLLGLCERYDDAFAELKKAPSEKICVAVAMVHFLRRDWGGVVDQADIALSQHPLDATKRRLLNVFASAALFRIAMGSAAETDSTYVVPVTGDPNINLEAVRKCWKRSLHTLQLMRSAGWPSDVTFLIEPLCLSAVHLNRVRDVLDEVWDIASARPHYVEVLEYAERMSVLAGEYERAVQANELQPATYPAKVRRLLLAFESHDYEKALELANALFSIRDAHADIDPIVLVIGGVSANQRLLSSDERIFRDALQSRHDLAPDYAVYLFLTKIKDSPLESRAARKELYESFLLYRESELLQSTLFPRLDARDSEEARACVEVATQIGQRRLLTRDELLHLAQAFVTLGHWADLLKSMDTALERFDSDPRLLAIKAIALEGRGETAAALSVLESVLTKSQRDPVLLDAYVNITVRCGFLEKAISQIEVLLSRERETHKSLDLLRTLFLLESVRAPSQQKLVDIAWRYGRLVDRGQEDEEGVFLQLFLMSTLSSAVNVTGAQQDEFQKRIDRFMERFPKSRMMQAVRFTEGDDPNELLEVLNKMSGLSDAKKSWIQARIAKLHRGDEVLPFVLRPRNILLNVSDVLHLWEIAKSSRRDAREFHLQIAASGRTDPEFNDVRKRVPILDITALLVLEDLGLFDVLLSLFPRIAVTKSTVLQLQEFSAPFMGSVYPEVAKRIADRLRDKIGSVLQPGTLTRNDQQCQKNETTEDCELRHFANDSAYVLYSDDVVFRKWIDEGAHSDRGICTADVLRWAVDRHILDVAAAARKIGLLCKWNVGGLRVNLAIFIAAIPEQIDRARTVGDAEEILASVFPFNEISDALWDYQNSYDGIAAHISGVLLHAIPQRAVSELTILALWRRWMTKVRVRHDAPVSGDAHLQGVFWRIAVSPTLRAEDMARSWSLYRKMVELEAGDNMSREIESSAIHHIARRLVKESTKRNLSDVEREKLFEKISSGFIKGTSDYSEFSNAYLQARIDAQRNRGKRT